MRPQIVKRGLAGIRRKDRWARLERASVGFCISVMHRCLHPGSNMSHLAMSACLPSSIIDLWLITCLLMTLENRFMMDIESASTCQLGGLHGRGRLAVIGPIGHGRHGAGASHHVCREVNEACSIGRLQHNVARPRRESPLPVIRRYHPVLARIPSLQCKPNQLPTPFGDAVSQADK